MIKSKTKVLENGSIVKISFVPNCCDTLIFKINDISANIEDFGERKDLEPNKMPKYCCGNMTFIPKKPLGYVLEHYHITAQEYQHIAHKLQKHLSLGRCNYCQ